MKKFKDAWQRIKYNFSNPMIFVPPVFIKILQKVKNKRAGIYYPFSNCNFNREDIRVVFDVGANIGDVALKAAKSFPNADIYAFEPVKKTYQALCENTKDYGQRIKTHDFGFLNVSDGLDINITSFHGANSILAQSSNYRNIYPQIEEINTEKIEVVTLDSFMANSNIDKIDIIKIDVEGVEKEVIEGGMETFKNKVDNVFIELSFLRRNRNSSYWIEICRLLYDLGFVLVNIYNIGRLTKDNAEYVLDMDVFFSKQR